MRTVLLLLFVSVSQFAFAQPSDEEAIKAVVSSAYIEGIQNRGNVEDIRKGFHPSFNMLRLSDNEIKPLAIEDWIANLEKAKANNVAPPAKTEGKFLNVDVTGNAAVVKLELFREGKKTFTDYLVLYKFTEGWRIVSKTFYRHP
ncbi:MAG TPA: nuclear transport factor 2 family protein [Chryseosolibacter sp.]|nr:nuclear transport factor 2 family protein [Chryseosolibacter sp.]